MAKTRRDKTQAKDSVARTHDPRRHDAPPDWLIFALAAFGVLLTGYLTWITVDGTGAAFCSAGSGCDVVQGSRWSNLFGIPIALLGLGLYALIALFALLPSRPVKRWRRVWSLALIGVAISLYLNLVAAVALQAACWWCLLSLVTITTIFVLTTIRRPSTAPGMTWRQWSINNAIVVAALVGSVALAQSGLLVPPENPRLQALAEHLTARGAKFYGAFWCANCQEQKDLFGRSAERLPYVECNPNGRQGALAFDCVSANIVGYPTWVIRGRSFVEVLTPEELAQRSGFDWKGFVEPADDEPARQP
jgi:uncharacterized membrane protein